MGKLQTASPRFSFRLGFLLLGVFPTDILTSWAVGTYLSNHGDPWWHYLPFVAAHPAASRAPAIMLLMFGQRAQAFLPKARDWMSTNSWVVSEVVIVFFTRHTFKHPPSFSLSLSDDHPLSRPANPVAQLSEGQETDVG